MNLRFLEAFYWIAKLGSFSAAAAKLHATPAAISERIRTLEEDLGVRVFERDSRRVQLTASGQRLLPYAEQMLNLRDAMKKSVQDSSAQTGIISIGVIESVVHTWLPQVLGELTRVYPGITVELYSDSTPRLKEELRADHLNLALLADEVDSDLFESVPLASDSMIWVAHPKTAALAVDTKSFEAVLASQPVMTFVRDTPAYRDVRRVLSNIIGVRINPFSSITGIIAMLRSGYGIAALPARVANSYIAQGQLAEIGCGPKLAPLRLLLARPASGREPVVDAVADLVATACIRLAEQEPS
jgi:DNA-binding transcriptional LysR family regulator